MDDPTSIATTRAFRELASRARADQSLEVRVQCADGSVVEGRLLELDASVLSVARADNLETARINARDVHGLYARAPNRNREGLLAAVGIVGAVAALTAYSTLPWVRPDKGDITSAFMFLYGVGGALLSLLLARTGLRRWLTEWRPLYRNGHES